MARQDKTGITIQLTGRRIDEAQRLANATGKPHYVIKGSGFFDTVCADNFRRQAGVYIVGTYWPKRGKRASCPD